MRRLWLALVVLFLPTAIQGAALPTVVHEGVSYVELDRVAVSLSTRLDATPGSINAYLRIPGHVVTFTRNWSYVLVDGTPLVLDAPVRVKAGVWLVPETFMVRVMPGLQPPAARPASAALPAKGTATGSTVPSPSSPSSAPARPSAATSALRGAGAPVILEDLRVRSYPSFTRVVVETSGPIIYRLEAGAGRETRVRIGTLNAEPRSQEIRDGLVAEARLERAGVDGILRVLFEGVSVDPKVSALVDPHRLVLDFRRPEEPAATERPAATPLRTIVLDAGHGGHDVGAQGPTGLLEKELVLDVTRRAARLAEERLGVKIRLSRDGDYFVPLRDRTSFANKERADLFVSIHANAHRDTGSAGVETYFLSSEATDTSARQVAAQENSVIQLESPAARAGRGDAVKAILWDLAQSEFQVESFRLAEVVLDSMTQSLRIPNRGVKQAAFYVLGGAAMPAVLIEIGFVTNPREERRLKESRYRDEIARAIVTGLAEYKRHWDQRMRPTAAERTR
jgi:N-acetylmuramoyl-L-alanine amidase